jgi:starch phosphorylase
MKASMKMAMADFCSHRMVGEYQQRFYLPAVQRRRELMADNAEEAKNLSVLHKRLKELWHEIKIEPPERDNDGPFQVSETFMVSVNVHLGAILPEEVDVELYYGRVRHLGELEKGASLPMTIFQERGNGDYLYRCTVTCNDSGRYGFTVRVVPRGDEWIRCTPGLLSWA